LASVVHVIDDDKSFRTAMSRLLQAAGYQVELYESAQQLLDRLPGDAAPGCILLDVKMSGLSGPDLQGRLIAMGLNLPIVFLTGHGNIETAVHAIKTGAEDFLTKPVAKDQLLEAIERALARHRTLRAEHDRLNSLRSLVGKLTPRERQVFELVVRGKMNKQIAFELGATERTIKAHRQKVMEKVGAQSLAELVSVAERLGLLAAQEDAGATKTGGGQSSV
jgi:FixJ family two-component response regulator